MAKKSTKTGTAKKGAHLQDSPKNAPRCRICNHEDREGIELLAIMSCSSWNICRERVNNTFGTNFTAESLKKHMTQHELHKTAAEQGVIIDSLRDEDGAPGRISAETMLQTLLVQGMMDLAKGKIRCRNVQDLMAVLSMLQNVQLRKEQKMAFEDGDLQSFYAVMAAYSEAIRDTVSQGQLMEIVAKANALGASFNISNARLEQPIEVEVEDIMEVAVKDYKERGHSRTREELIEAGIIEEIEDGLELPD